MPNRAVRMDLIAIRKNSSSSGVKSGASMLLRCHFNSLQTADHDCARMIILRALKKTYFLTPQFSDEGALSNEANIRLIKLAVSFVFKHLETRFGARGCRSPLVTMVGAARYAEGRKPRPRNVDAPHNATRGASVRVPLPSQRAAAEVVQATTP